MIVPLKSTILPVILLTFASHYIVSPSLINSPLSDFIRRCNCRQRDWEDSVPEYRARNDSNVQHISGLLL